MGLILNKAQAEAVANAMAHLNNVGATAQIWMAPCSDIRVTIGGVRLQISKRLASCKRPYEEEDYPTQYDFLVAYGLE